MEKMLAAVEKGFDERQQQRFDAELTRPKVRSIIDTIPQLRTLDLRDCVLQLVFKSTQAIERVLDGGDPQKEIMTIHVYSIQQMRAMRPESAVLKSCEERPGWFAVCVDSFLTPEYLRTHAVSAYAPPKSQ